MPVKALVSLPLWSGRPPEWSRNLWPELKTRLASHDEDWDVWTQWYDAVLEGKPTPGGEELDIYRVRLDYEEDWKKGPAFVNAKIKAKEEEIDRRARELQDTAQFTGTVGLQVHGEVVKNPREIQHALDRLSEQTFRPSVVVRDNKLALDFVEGDQTVDPLAERMHPDVLKFARRLSSRAPRLMNSHKEAAEDCLGLLHLIDRPFEEVVGLDVEIWNFSLALGEHLQEDNLKSSQGRQKLTPPA